MVSPPKPKPAMSAPCAAYCHAPLPPAPPMLHRSCVRNAKPAIWSGCVNSCLSAPEDRRDDNNHELDQRAPARLAILDVPAILYTRLWPGPLQLQSSKAVQPRDALLIGPQALPTTWPGRKVRRWVNVCPSRRNNPPRKGEAAQRLPRKPSATACAKPVRHRGR